MFCCLSLFYYLIYGLFAIFLALISALVVSERFRKAFFVWVLTTSHYCKYLIGLFTSHRTLWLKEFTELKCPSTDEKLKVLEIGVGFGANFELYPDNCIVTVLDYKDNFKDECMKNIEKQSKIQFDKYMIGSVEDMDQIEDNTYDVVLITHVFCIVENVQKGLKEVKRVLKKGGKYFFMEHVGYHDPSLLNNFWSGVQYVVNPLWKIMFGDCNLNRKNWILLENAGFKSIKINYSYPETLPGYIRPNIWGCAIK